MSRHAAPFRPLAHSSTDLFGRERELATARDLVSSSRLVTLTGPGGVGKTSLAVAMAGPLERTFGNGVWFVELGAQRSSDTIVETVATNLGLSAVPTMDAEEQLCRHVAGRSMLLILDNCEHVLPGCRRLVAALLTASSELRVLTTSREPLGVRGERVIVVRPLPVPPKGRDVTVGELRDYPAVAMLEARAKAVNDQFEITEGEMSSVAELVARLDGMPLAIELAAARLRSLPVRELLDRINDRFALLNRGDPTATPHHHSLDALVRWSYDLCSPEEQLLWGRLAVFSGSPDLVGIQTVCGFPPLEGTALLDALDGLVSKSILLPELARGEMRYRLLETLREFALERAHGSEDHVHARNAHAEHYRVWAAETARSFFGPGQADSLQRVQSDFTNLELAFNGLLRDPGRSRDALEVASSLRFYWITGHLRDGRRWLERALETDTAASLERGNALRVAASVAALHGELPRAQGFLKEAGEIARSIEDSGLAAHVATWTGEVALASGDLEAAREALEAAYLGHMGLPDTEGQLTTLFLLGIVKSALGDHQGASDACWEAVGLSESLGEKWARSYALWVLALDAWTRQSLDAAVELATESLELKRDFRDDLGTALAINLMAGIALDDHDPKKAAQLLGVVAALWTLLDTGTRAFGPVLAPRYEGIAPDAQDRLGEGAFQRFFETGRRLDPGRHIDLALGCADTAEKDQAGAGSASDLLTPREREVAALLAEGLSNRAIAAKLVLSPRTVEVHVEHILSKLGFRSRTEAGLWAAQALQGKV
ncbi:LuxR family transcriptional regulator [Streptomyces umbrinus]|uniref:ATP-binding protein n=1 Tax=Streptomyces umbrinus TaxID=67370 RepID=UPI0019A8572D|nr:LuxR C-terminal-related transcriptional regulator [Streptomyces umbrinus]GHB59391.1 LuxR family transcriptional regulator [Streptomyces umbrinus]